MLLNSLSITPCNNFIETLWYHTREILKNEQQKTKRLKSSQKRTFSTISKRVLVVVRVIIIQE